MADKRITELNLHTSLELGDVLPIVNSSETKKAALGSVNTFIRNQDTPLTASGIVVSDAILPQIGADITLGSIERPFKELFLQSGSIHIESKQIGELTVDIVNNLGNLDISSGGMRLVEPGNSFIAETGSFQYISGSMTQVGDYLRIGNTISTGSTDLNGPFTASLQEGYIWLGDSNNRSTPTPSSSLLPDGLVSGSEQIDITQTQNYGDVMITGSLNGSAITFTKGDSSTFDIELGNDFVQVSYLSTYSTSSQQLIQSGAAQVVTFDSVWAESGIHVVNGSELTFDEAAAYEFKFIAKVENSDNAVHEVWFWIKYNGENFPNSATRLTLPPRKNSEETSSQLMTISITGVAQNNGDYIELYWTGDSTLISLHADSGNTVVPSSPSIIASLIRV